MRSLHIAALAALVTLGCIPRQVSKPVTTTGPTSATLGSELDEFLSRAGALGYSGVWLVQQNGTVILDKGYGYADREAGVRFTSASLFALGSIPKQFAATAILSLQDEGRLRVSDSIGRFFPGFPDDKRGITIHHLLTHTGGLPTYSGPDDELITRDTLIARMMKVKLRSKPGEKFAYSNPSYSLLAAIVESVTGEQYERYLRRKILDPLGMTSTVSDLRKVRRENLPLGYLGDRAAALYRTGDGGRLADGTLSWNIVGGAGFVSTTQDMLRWAGAWQDGRILSDSARRIALTRHVRWGGSDTSRYYGYGWILDGPPDDRVEWHSGGDGASAAYFHRYIDRGLTTISFTNHSQGPSQLVLSSVPASLKGSPFPDLPTARVQLDPEALSRFVGSYLLPSGDTLSVTLSNGQLVIPMDRRGAASATTCFAPLKDSSSLHDIEGRVSRIFLALSRNDQRPALDVVWPGTSLTEEGEYWSSTWPEWIRKYGAYRGVELIGSLPGTSTLRPGVPLIDTYFFLRFERGQYLVTVKQDPDGKLYFDTSTTSLLQPRYYYVPQGVNAFETYNFLLRTRSPLNFEINAAGVVTGAHFGCSLLHGRKV